MKNRERFSSGILTAICILLLTACGGGGGDDSSNGGDNPPPLDLGPIPSYSGRTEPAQIGRDNALELARTTMSAAAIVLLLDSLWVPYPDNAENQKETVQGGSGSATIELSGGVLTMSFDKYTDRGLTLNGIITETASANTPTWLEGRHQSHIDGTMEFDRVRVTGQGVDVSLHGTVEGEEYNHLTFNLLMEDKVAGEAGKLENFVVERRAVVDEYDWADWYETYLSGRLYDSRLGWVDVATIAPMHEFEFDQDGLPGDQGRGILDITGAGAGLQLLTLNQRHAALVLDEDSDGAYETGLRLGWNQLLSQEPLESAEGDGTPVANPGVDLESNIGRTTLIHGLFSHDADNQFLSYHWRLLAAPPGAQAAMPSESRSAYFNFVPEVRGSYLLALSVSDGERVSESTLKIHVPREIDAYSFDERLPLQSMRGQLEVGISPDQGEYTFDADSLLKEEEEEWEIEIYGYGAEAYPLDSDFGAIRRILYNPNGVPGIIRAASSLEKNGYGNGLVPSSLVSIGLDRFERFTETWRETCGSLATVAVEFGSGRGADILQHCNSEAGYFLLLSRQDETLTPSRLSGEPIAISSGNEHLTLGDINGDGWPDAVTLGTRYRVVEGREGIHLSLQVQDDTAGGRTLAEPQVYPFHGASCSEGEGMVAVDIADFDADGHQDVLALEECGFGVGTAPPATLTVWPGIGDGQLGEPRLFELPSLSIRAVDFADFNGDGRQDLALVGCEGDYCGYEEPLKQLNVFLNLEEGFSRSQILLDQENVHMGLAAADVSGDGRVDLIYSRFRRLENSYSRENIATLFVQQEGGSFAQSGELSGFFADRDSLTVVDINDDGRTDLVGRAYMDAEGYDAPVLALGKVGGGHHIVQLYGGGRSERDLLSIADMDGDGMLDIVLDGGNFVTYFAGPRAYAVPVEPAPSE